jgi:murein DD-endopeptidase MepM/ murein hydrolase activator NlpD
MYKMARLLLIVFSFYSFSGFAGVISPGHVRFFSTKLKSPLKDFNILCGNKKIPLFLGDDQQAFTYISQSYFSSENEINCKLKYLDGKEEVFVFKSQKFDYPEETLKVSKSKVKLSKENLDRVYKEQQKLNEIYKKSVDVFLFENEFSSPLETELTSKYGKKRVFNKVKKGQHLGNDFRAAVGTKIPSSNMGKVVLADDLFYSGKTVIIDHGMGIFSMYGHLDKILVKSGRRVRKGEVLGLAGATGRVTGPHLHWGVKVHGDWIDGLELVKESQKQFAAN